MIFLFASATTFQSLGILVFAMVGEFGWTEAEAGGAFMSLGLACCATALLPVFLIRAWGARWTVVAGTLILAVGFLVANRTSELATIYVAAALFGAAFSLVANTCGIYLIAGWFGPRAPRMIGLYLMSGTLGGAVGPPVAEALISDAGGWRGYWLVVSAAAIVLALVLWLLVREPPEPSLPDDGTVLDRVAFEYVETLRTPQFAVLALAMVITQTALLTVSGVAPAHFFRLGWPGGFAAAMLGAQALIGTIATGVSGWLTEQCDPKLILAAGLAAEGVGLVLLAVARTSWVGYGFALSFGIGWSIACLAITVLLIRYFGNRAGTAALSTIWMLSGVAALGPSVAGAVADRTGSFTLPLTMLGLALLPVALMTLALTAPRRGFDKAGPVVSVRAP